MVTFLSQGVLVTSSYKNFSESEVTNAKSDEPNKWKIHNVYDNVANSEQIDKDVYARPPKEANY